jgi:hypothetical protein
MSGGAISDVGVDDVYLSMEEAPVSNTAVCYATSLSIAPKNATIKTGAKKKFTATAKNQYEKPTDANVTWESKGGTILQDGSFSANEAGVYTVIGRMDNLSDSTTITVHASNSVEKLDKNIAVTYSPVTRMVTITGMNEGSYVEIYNVTGAKLFSGIASDRKMMIPLNIETGSSHILKIQDKEKIEVKKFIAQ